MWEACELAQLYHQLTHDDAIPIPLALLSLDGILNKRIEGQSLKRLQTAILMLRAINSPFTLDEGAAVQPPRDEDMLYFVIDYLQGLSEAKQPPSSNQQPLNEHVKLFVRHLIAHAHQLLESNDFQKNKFDFYFNHLVPYVKACRGDWTPLPALAPEPILIKQLLQELHRSQAIRKLFGPYCLTFDVFHVFVGCYVCCTDLAMVTNWALDFFARVCRGQFFWKQFEQCAFVQQVLHVLDTDITYKKNTDLYYVKRALQKGEGIECLSENFAKYGQLAEYVRDKIRVPEDLKILAMHNLFPSVLFKTHDTHIAFSVAIAYISNKLDTKSAQVRKGQYAKARRLFTVIEKLIQKVDAFDAKHPIAWTLDTLDLFILSQKNNEKEVAELFDILFGREENE